MCYGLSIVLCKRVFKPVIVVILLFFLGGCSYKEPILIGFAGELTGINGGLGVAARDGVQLAIDEINEKGGIQGRPLELMVRDDKGDPEIARQVDTELIEQGVIAIIGHITSGQTAAVFDQMNKAEVVLLSPASSSSQFSGQSDYFFRVVPSTDLIGKSLAIHIYDGRNVRQLAGIYDLDNRAFAEPLWQAIQAQFTELGGEADKVFTFQSGETDLKSLMSQVKVTEPEAMVFIASPIDTALMVQYGQQQGLEAQLFSSSWARTDELLAKGGQAVEGLELAAGYAPQNPYPAFERFVERFEARYSRQPDMLASNGYEAVLVLEDALEQTAGQASGLPEALATINNLEGTQGVFSMDAYGDAEREIYIIQVKDGQFKLVNIISPASRE